MAKRAHLEKGEVNDLFARTVEEEQESAEMQNRTSTELQEPERVSWGFHLRPELVRRVKMLALTPAGARLRDELGERMSVPPSELEELPAADQRALRDILKRAVASGESG